MIISPVATPQLIKEARDNARRSKFNPGLIRANLEVACNVLDDAESEPWIRVWIAERLRMVQKTLQEGALAQTERLAKAGEKIVELEDQLEKERSGYALLEMELGEAEGARDGYKAAAARMRRSLDDAYRALDQERWKTRGLAGIMAELTEELKKAEAELEAGDDDDSVDIVFVFGGAPGLGPDLFSEIALALYADQLECDESE